MRTRIFTSKERDIIERFIKEGLKLNGFATLKYRVLTFKEIERDIELYNRFKEELLKPPS